MVAKTARYYDAEVARVCRFLIPEGASVLELGAGTGDLLAALRPARGVGIDLRPEMARLARHRHPHLEFHVAWHRDVVEPAHGLSWLLDQRLTDTLCGTKVLWRRDYLKIKANRRFFGDVDPFGDFDLLLGAAQQHFKILEMPVCYRARTYGTTSISRFRHGWLLLQVCAVAYRKLKVA